MTTEEYQNMPSYKGRVNRMRAFYEAVESVIDLSNLGLYPAEHATSHIGVLKEVFGGRKDMDRCAECGKPNIATEITTRFTRYGLLCADCLDSHNSYEGRLQRAGLKKGYYV